MPASGPLDAPASSAPTGRVALVRGALRRPEHANLVWLLAERAVQMPVGFLVSALVARHLGVESYGVLAYALSLAVLVMSFSSAGQPLVVRDLSAGRVPEGTVLATAATAQLLGTAISATSAVLLLKAAPGLGPEGALVPLLLVLLGPTVRSVAVAEYWLQAHLQAPRAVRARLLGLLGVSVARVVAVLAGAGVEVFAALVAAEAAMTVSLLVLVYRRARSRAAVLRIDRGYLREYLKEALPLLGATLAVSVYMRIDMAMLGGISGAAEAGRYAVAVLVAELVYVLPVLLNTVLLPGMTRLFERDRQAYEARLQGLFSGVLLLTVVTGGLAAVTGPFVISLVYGPEFDGVAPVFLLLLLSAPFVGVGVVQGIWTANTRQQGLGLARTLMGAVTNVALNALLIPEHGAVGAALSTVVAYGVAATFGNLLLPPAWPVLRMQGRALRLRGLRGLVAAILRRDEEVVP